MKKSLKVMDSTGDSSVEFDTEVADSKLSEAREFFDKLMAKGSVVFALGQDGKGDHKVSKFDELAAENVVVPRI